MDTDPIVFDHMKKTFGDFTAVDDLTFSVKRNSFTGFLGPNGAGKSTSLKVLTRLIRPTSGQVYLNGYDITKEATRALEGVGTVVETPEFYGYMSPRQTFSFIGELIGLTKETIAAQTDEILEEIRMTDWIDKPIGKYSKGMKQRIALGQAMIGDPSIIILDEPTSGLDPRGMAEIRETLKNIRNKHNDLTILMSSHILPEVQDLCDNIVMIDHGKLLLNDTMANVLGSNGKKRITVKTIRTPSEEDIARVGNLDYVLSAGRVGTDIDVRIDIAQYDCREQLLKDIVNMGIGAYSVYEDDSLEATFLNLTGGQVGEDNTREAVM